MQPINKMDKETAKEFGKEKFKVEFVIEEQNENMAKAYLNWFLHKASPQRSDWSDYKVNLKRIKLTKVT